MTFATLSHEEVLSLRKHIEQDIAKPNPSVREQLEKDVEAFLANGGVIEKAESKQLYCVVGRTDLKNNSFRRVWSETPSDFSFSNFKIRGAA